MGQIGNNRRNSIRQKTQPIGSTVVGIKKTTKSVFSKTKQKQVTIDEYKGSFTSSNGTGFSLKISKSSEEKFKNSGVAYWLEVTEWDSNNNNNNR